MSENTLRQSIDNYLDWLSDLSEEEIRQRFPESRLPNNIDFVWEIGGTEYTVTSHFNQNARDDVYSKVQRLLESEVLE